MKPDSFTDKILEDLDTAMGLIEVDLSDESLVKYKADLYQAYLSAISSKNVVRKQSTGSAKERLLDSVLESL